MTARVPAYSPSVWRKAAFCGRVRLMVRYRSRRPSSDICFPGSIGDIPRKPGVQRRWADDFGFEALGEAWFCRRVTRRFAPLPTDLASAHALILIERAARLEAEAAAAHAQAVNTSTDALIAHLKLEIEKLRRALYGSRSERKARLLEQIELQLEELEAAATEDELAAEKAAARTQGVKSFERKRPSRKPFPEHLPRERVVIRTPRGAPRQPS